MKRVKENLPLILSAIVFSGVFVFFTFVHYQRLAAFGCFDDCFNYVGGYLILKGKQIYSDFFFNHNLLMPYMSFLIQKITEPKDIYSLLLYHRLFLFVFSFLMGLLIIYRFKIAGLLTLVLFESTKFYVFGDRFLGESFIVYPLIYMTGLVWDRLNGRPLNNFDILVSGVFAWFCVFAREPYIPLTLALFLLILLGRENLKVRFMSLLIFIVASLASLLGVSLKDYYLNLYAYNSPRIKAELIRNDAYGINFYKVFIQPIRVFFTGEWNLFRQILIGISSVFFVSGIIYTIRLKRIAFIIMILILGVSNTRPVSPGLIFYESYHTAVWYALFIFITFLIVQEIYRLEKLRKISLAFFAIPAVLLIYLFLNPLFFAREKINTSEELTTNYGNYYAVGKVIGALSDKNDTLFLDGSEELIAWETKLDAPYKYSWYTSSMPLIPLYSEERIKMLRDTSPDFYYGTCGDTTAKNQTLPAFAEKDYKVLLFLGKPSCIRIHNSKIAEIPSGKWDKIKKMGYELKNL